MDKMTTVSELERLDASENVEPVLLTPASLTARSAPNILKTPDQVPG